MKKLFPLFSLIILMVNGFSQSEWQVIHPYPTSDDLIDVHFVSDMQGWVCGKQGLIMHTQDGGETWNTQHQNPDESLWSIYFVDDMFWREKFAGSEFLTFPGMNWQINKSQVAICG